MTREEAEAIVALRSRLATNTQPRAKEPLCFAQRPNRSLPIHYHVVSFFVVSALPELHFELVDPFLRTLFPGPTAKYRWRAGGVREWDGFVLDTKIQDARDFISEDVSQRLYGSQRLLFAGGI